MNTFKIDGSTRRTDMNEFWAAKLTDVRYYGDTKRLWCE